MSEPTTEGWELDAAIAEHVLGFHVERVTPDWYRGREVLLFFSPGETLVSYSADANACNAMMYCNGRDASDGTAPPLPAFSTDMAAAWRVVEKLATDGFYCRIDSPFEPGALYRAGFTPHGVTGWNGRPDFRAAADTAPLAICRAALACVGRGTTGGTDGRA
jgi:hypothetical protein